ncbi:E3 ubiquitin protein ligase SIRP1-like protein [Tanacetum coccineum]|uniref:E3 ubiquitin protein ligase SIRP1-like protein n=1 Tax=Tanacetum coccineum TaxID=301880 RepID=A0ABQ4Y3R5_9ASTR
MSSSKETKPSTNPPYYEELCLLGQMAIDSFKSQPEKAKKQISSLRSYVAFHRAKQNKRSKLAIEALPTVTSPPHDEKCHICLEKFVAGKQVKEMGCKHLFHKECIVDKALGVKAVASCPVCGEKVQVRYDKLLGEDMDWDELDDAFFQRIQGYVQGGDIFRHNGDLLGLNCTQYPQRDQQAYFKLAYTDDDDDDDDNLVYCLRRAGDVDLSFGVTIKQRRGEKEDDMGTKRHISQYSPIWGI